MKKKLSEMTLDELWQLFPIFLTEHNEKWNLWFNEEKQNILNFTPFNVKIHHIGSTAISKIWAKPIVDILVETESRKEMQELAHIMESEGYILMNESNIPRISLNKGYTADGFAERVFHIHLRINGDNDELYFRDYLNKNPNIAKKYEKLKLDLWKQYKHDRDGYTNAKTDFVKKYTKIAKMQNKNTYL